MSELVGLRGWRVYTDSQEDYEVTCPWCLQEHLHPNSVTVPQGSTIEDIVEAAFSHVHGKLVS